MVVIQNIIHDATVDEEKLKLTCQQFIQEFDVGDSELVVRLVSPIEIQTLNKEYRSKNQVSLLTKELSGRVFPQLIAVYRSHFSFYVTIQ